MLFSRHLMFLILIQTLSFALQFRKKKNGKVGSVQDLKSSDFNHTGGEDQKERHTK